MKLKILLTFSFFIQFVLNAQLNIQFNVINEYAFNTREAVNFTAINSTAKSFEIEFNGKILGPDGQTVVEFKTNSTMLNPGSNMFNSMNLGIKSQLYFNQDIAEIEVKTGNYPSGNYTICIWSNCLVPDCNGAGQYAGSVETPFCTQIHIENPTPLILAFPENESEIEEQRPLYTWIPPAPVAGSTSLNYTMTLVEILEGQSKADALAMNRPLIEMQGIDNPLLMHPLDIDELEKGKTYAWQVEAFVGRTSIAKSEQWKFKVKKEIPKKVAKVSLTMKSNKAVFAYEVKPCDSISLVFEQNYNIDLKADWNISMKNEFTGENIDVSRLQVNKTYIGLNEILLIPFENVDIIYNSYYLIELRNLKNEKFYIRIIFTKQN